jgi:translocation and assembly module TamB
MILRGTLRAVAWLGWVLLGAAALLGLALSAVALLAAVPVARTAIASAVVRVVDDALAGSVKLEQIEVLARGGIELRGLEVFDPDGHLVLAVGRARLSADVTALRARTIGIEVELEAPSVLLEEEADGGTSLARAFAPAGRPPEPGAGRGGGGAPGPGAAGEGGSGWTVHLSRLEIRGGELWWVDALGSTRLEAAGLDVAARGTLGPRRARAEVRLRGEMREPVASPVALDLVASRAGDGIRVPLLRLEAGGTALSALGEGDLARRRGRLAVTRLGIAREQARVLVPAAPEGDDLLGSGYAESDGATLTAALRVEPGDEGAPGGRGDAAVAVRLDALGRAAGFDVALDRLDPGRLVATAPPGEVTLTARGAAAGTSFEDARGRVALSVSRSRLRRGELSRAEVELRAARGTLEVERLSAAAPGVTVRGAGRWRRGGAAAGSATVDAPDLAVASRNLARLLGEPAPDLAGRARVVAELSGSSAAPALAGTLDAPSLRSGTVVADGVHLVLRGTGPLRSGEGRVEGRIAQVRNAAGRELARQVALRAAIQGDEGTLSATASLPGTGREPFIVDARGRLGARRKTLLLGQLALAWPRARWTLARPATLDLRGPSVDRLELAAGAQRIAISGGLGARGALDARVELSQVDLARLPPGVLAAEDGVRGEISASLEASGTVRRPVVQARMALANGAFRGVAGVAARGDGRFDGAGRRATAALSVARAAGGTIDVAFDHPVPIAGRAAEDGRGARGGAPLAELLGATRRAGAAGTVAIDARVEGTAGAPALAGEATLEDGTWEDLEAIAATVTIDDPGGTLHVSASGSIAGRRVLGVDAQVPLDLGDLVARPEETLRALERAPVQARANVTALDLATLAGRAGIPQGIAGLVDARADLAGTAAAPRGVATVDVAGAAWKGWRRLGAHLELSAREQGLAASGRIASAGQDALRFQGSLGVRPERLTRRDAFLAAPLEIEAVIPRVALAPAAGEALPVAGTLDGRIAASGTLRAPRVAVDVSGTGVSIEGRPLGDAHAKAHYAERHSEAEVTLSPSSGGTLRATLDVSADLGLGARGVALRDAQAKATAASGGVDLGFLAAVAPGTIRSAAGQLALDVRAEGPLGRLSPRGTLHVTGGRLAIAELGEWTDIAIDAGVTDDDVKVSRLDVRRGKGSLSASGALRGLRSEAARLSARVEAKSFTVARAGMDLATFDVVADASGSWRGGDLAVVVAIPHGVVRLPKKSPRTLQSLERRKDIVVGRRAEKKKEEAARAAPTGSAAEPFSVHARVVVPRNFFVKSDNPKMDVELKADVSYDLADGSADGTIEVKRGNVEPIAGRNFTIERGKVQFTGGPPLAALLDIEATYHNPAADVTATVVGPLRKPELRLSSKPEMDQGQIALLLATGRTELKPGAGATSTLTGEEAGRAALGAVATQAFRNLVQDKLPLDTVALDSGQFRAGEYLTDKIYVGYVRRFDADPTKNENENEVRVEYQITPRFMFESRYGNAQSGGASLIWSRDY